MNIVGFEWTITTLDDNQNDDIQLMVLDCLRQMSLIYKWGIKSIEITGYAKGYGPNLPKYARRRAGSVNRKIIRTMRSLGYPQQAIRMYKSKVKLKKKFSPGFRRYQTREWDRRVEIKINRFTSATGQFKIKRTNAAGGRRRLIKSDGM